MTWRKRKRFIYNLGLKDGEEYIFLHDDPERGFVIDKKYLRDIKTIHLVDHKDISIFRYSLPG